MKNMKLLFTASFLFGMSLGISAVSYRQYCGGFEHINNFNNCAFGNVFAWTSSSANTMALFTFDAGTLSNYTQLTFTTSDFLTTETLGANAETYRIVFVYGTNSTDHADKKFASIGEKTITFADESSIKDHINNVTCIAIGGVCNSGMLSINPGSIVLSNADHSQTLTCSGITSRSDNSNCSYKPNRFYWKESTSNLMKIFSVTSETLNNYEYLNLVTSDYTGAEANNSYYYRVVCLDNNNNTVGKAKLFTTAGDKNFLISEMISEEQKASVVSIAFGGQSNNGAITIDPASIYLERKEAINFVSPIQGFKWYQFGSNTEIERNTTNLHKRVDSATELGNNAVIYGPTSENGTTDYIIAKDYSKVEFTTVQTSDGNAGFRFIHRDNTILTVDTSTPTTYSSDFSTDTIANIKTKIFSEQNTCSSIKISSINFTKSFDPSANTAWSFAKDVEQTSVNYNRTFTVDRSCTICLPFALTSTEVTAAGEFYQLNKYENGILQFLPVTETEAYTPYLFIPSAATPFTTLTNKTIIASPAEDPKTEVTGATFFGTLQHTSALTKSGYTLYGYSATSGEFVQVGSNVSIDAFRAYIAVPDNAPAPARMSVLLQERSTATDLKETVAPTNCYKVLRNGQLIIIREGHEYNLQGQLLK